MNFPRCLLKFTKQVRQFTFCNSHSHTSINTREFADRRVEFIRKICLHKEFECYNSSRHLAIIPAGEIQYMSLHVPYTFHQDSYFRYLTGIVEPNAVLTIEASSINSKSGFSDNLSFVPRLFVEERNEHDRLWDGPTLGVDAASKLSGIPETLPLNFLSEYLSSAFSQLTNSSDFVWFGLPFIAQRKEKAPLNRKILNSVSSLFSECAVDRKQLRDPYPLIDELRVIKSPREISLLQRAADITSKSLKNVMQSAFPGIAEDELSTRMECESRLMGSRLGYPAVVAGGSRATIIHYLNNNMFVEDNQLVLMDVGSEVEGYTADITRTWPINGRFTAEQRILHEILVRVQNDCQQAANPENSLQTLYSVMLKRIANYLIEEKVLRGGDEVEAMVQKICPHHVGHFLGLDVHDTPSIPYSQPFAPGMVFPLEPGIYFPLEGRSNFHVPPEFRGLGLRLEDDYVFTSEGNATKISNELSSDANEIESYTQRKPLSKCDIPVR